MSEKVITAETGKLHPDMSADTNAVKFTVDAATKADSTLFHAAAESVAVYKVTGMTDDLMNQINGLLDERGHASVSERCDEMIRQNCRLEFVGFPVAARAGEKAFGENLDTINERLPAVIDFMLRNYFVNHDRATDLCDVLQRVIQENPCRITHPEVKYPYMIKAFLYAAYCGMTASTLWDGKSRVNGGFIKVSRVGDVVAYYALESDTFKTYLLNNCYLEFPSTDEKHGNYGKVYKENGEYYFNLNFQIRYR